MNRGFHRVVGAAWMPCGVCGHTRMEHYMRAEGTTDHEFITRRDLKKDAEAAARAVGVPGREKE